MKESFFIDGLKDLVKDLEDIDPKNRVKEIRAAARLAVQPIIEYQKANANFNLGDLEASINVAFRVGSRSDPARVLTARVGPMKKTSGRGDDKHDLIRINAKAIAQEYGNVKQVPIPFIRPSLENNKDRVMTIFKTELKRIVETRRNGKS